MTFPAWSEIKTLSQWINSYSQDGIGLFYSSEYVTPEILQQPVDLNEWSAPEFNRALAAFSLQLQAVESSAVNDNYIIRPASSAPRTTVLIHAQDETNQNPIKQFKLAWPSGQTIDSRYGAIVLNLNPQDRLSFSITAPGYQAQPILQSLVTGQTIGLMVSMQPLPLALSDIQVSTSLINYNSGPYSQHGFSRQQLDRQITFNQDPLRSQEQLPGSAGNGISGKSHTRGGNQNEAMILLDGRELRNPYHFKDFYALFSTINDSVVGSIDHYSGVFPVQYGGRLSAVIDVQTTPLANGPAHQLNVGLLTSSYSHQRQFEASGNTALLAVRSGGQLFNSHLADDLNIEPEFEDAYFKIEQSLSPRWRMSQHLLVSRDEIAFEEAHEMTQADYHDQNLWWNGYYDDWQHHSMQFQLYGSRRHDRRVGQLSDDQTEAQVREEITSHFQGLQFSHQWQMNDQWLLHYGIDLATEDTRINAYRQLDHHGPLPEALGLARQSTRQLVFDEHGVSAKSFANVRYQINDQWTADLGVHYQHQQWIQGGDLSPRFNLAYFISDRTTWRLGVGRHQQTQHIDELLLEDPNPSYFAPASADLAVLEFNHHFAGNWQMRAEVYVKKYSQTHPYHENLFDGLHVLPDLFFDRIRLDPNDAQAHGFEWRVSGQHKQLNWSASYTYSEVTDQFDQQQVQRSWHQRHAMKWLLGMPLGSWYLNVNASYHDGWPLTRIINNNGDLTLGQRNRAKHRDFFQLNLKLNKSWVSTHGTWSTELSLLNALNNDNPCCLQYSLDGSALEVEEKGGLPLVPSWQMGYSWD